MRWLVCMKIISFHNKKAFLSRLRKNYNKANTSNFISKIYLLKYNLFFFLKYILAANTINIYIYANFDNSIKIINFYTKIYNQPKLNIQLHD